LREVFNGLRWIARAGAPWRLMPNDLPPWWVVYQQTRAVAGSRLLCRSGGRPALALARSPGAHPAAILESRTLQSTPESGSHAGYDGAKRRNGSKVHAAVDTLGNLLALLVTPANEQDRAQVGELAAAVQEVTGQTVEVAFVDQAYPGDVPAAQAQQHGIHTNSQSVVERMVVSLVFIPSTPVIYHVSCVGFSYNLPRGSAL